MNKTKILFILPKTQQGGAENQLLYLLRGLDKKKFDVHLGLLYKDNEMKKEYDSLENVAINYFNKRHKFDFSIYVKIYRYIKKNGIDIVQAFMGHHHAIIPAFMAKIVGIGSVRSSIDFSALSIYWKFTVKLNCLIVNHMKSLMIANSHAGMQMYEKVGYQKDKLVVIPNGINFNRFSKGNPTPVRKLYGLKNKLVLSYVSRMDVLKNQIELVKMMKNLVSKNNLLLLLVGDGPNFTVVKEEIDKEDMQDHITLCGLRKDIPDILAASDIFVFPSRFPEGWPNAIGEAMSAGLPCVAYENGDINKIIENGVDGFVTPRDIGVFQERVEELCRNPAMRKKMSLKAKTKIRKEYTIESMVKKYEEVYVSLMKSC